MRERSKSYKITSLLVVSYLVQDQWEKTWLKKTVRVVILLLPVMIAFPEFHVTVRINHTVFILIHKNVLKGKNNIPWCKLP